MSELHDIEIREYNPDEQSTVWIMECKKCGRRSKPLYSKSMAEGATNERSCPGVKNTHRESGKEG